MAFDNATWPFWGQRTNFSYGFFKMVGQQRHFRVINQAATLKECSKILDNISFVWLSNDDRIIIGFISSGKLMFVSVKISFTFSFSEGDLKSSFQVS